VTGRPLSYLYSLSLCSFPVALSSQQMNIVKMLAELRQEREQVNEAIAVLEG
jgi:hypothetical protein